MWISVEHTTDLPGYMITPWRLTSTPKKKQMTNKNFSSVTDSQDIILSLVWFREFMPFNATFNNISVISLRLVLLVEETGLPGEKPMILMRGMKIT